MLHTMWGDHLSVDVARMINRRCGTRFTRNAVRVKAFREGLNTRTNRGDLCLSDAARELGVSIDAVKLYLKRAGIEPAKGSRAKFVGSREMSAMKSHFKKPPEPVIPLLEAAKSLHIDAAYLRRLCVRGVIRSYKILGNRWVSSTDVSQFRMRRARAAAA